MGTAAALYRRERTGAGLKVETSMMAGALLFGSKIVSEGMAQASYAIRTSVSPAGGQPFYSLHQCADGEWIHVACIHGGFTKKAAEVLGISHVLEEPRFSGGRGPSSEEARRELYDVVANAVRVKTCAEWERIFEEADVPYGRACTTDEAMDNPQVRANGMVVRAEHPRHGPMEQMGPPIALSETPGRVGPASEPPARPAEDAGAGGPSRGEEPASSDWRPLSGVRVLEVTNVIAGPTAGRLLADLGADVVKLEPPGGEISRDIARDYFYYLNSNKRGVSVDAKEPRGREAVRRIADSADVVLSNTRPGAIGRMGVDKQSLRETNPGLIEASVTAFGESGPYSHRPGLDPLSQAMMGLGRAQGGTENPPVYLGRLAITDFAAGGLAALGSIIALYVRERTGVSQRVSTNLLNSGILLNAEEFTRFQGKPPAARWTRSSTASARCAASTAPRTGGSTWRPTRRSSGSASATPSAAATFWRTSGWRPRPCERTTTAMPARELSETFARAPWGTGWSIWTRPRHLGLPSATRAATGSSMLSRELSETFASRTLGHWMEHLDSARRHLVVEFACPRHVSTGKRLSRIGSPLRPVLPIVDVR